MKKIILITIPSIIFFVAGLYIGSKNALPKYFFEINIYDVCDILFTIIIGVVITYYVNIQNSKESKKIEYIIKICNDLDSLLEEKSYNISSYLKDFSDDKYKKEILLFFKTISSKISVITKLNIKTCKEGAVSISSTCEDYRDTITGDEWGKKSSFDDAYIEKFKKDITTCRSTLQVMISNCLNY